MKNQNKFMLIAAGLLLSAKLFSMNGSALEQQFREEIRNARWDNAEEIVRKIFSQNNFALGSKLDFDLTKAKINAHKKTTQAQQEIPTQMTPPPPPPPMEDFKPYVQPEPKGDQFANINKILAKATLGMVDKRVLEEELNNPNLPQELRVRIEERLYVQLAPPPPAPVYQAPPAPVGDQFANVKKILAKPELGMVDKRILEEELNNPNVPQELKARIEEKLYVQLAPPPPAPVYQAPPAPIGDQFANTKKILAKSTLGMVDRRVLEEELKNQNLPYELRAEIEAKLGGGSSTSSEMTPPPPPPIEEFTGGSEMPPPPPPMPDWMNQGGQTGKMQSGSLQ